MSLRSCHGRRLARMAAGLAALLISSSVQGSPLSYTVTDLGVVGSSTQPISFTRSAAPTPTATKPPFQLQTPVLNQFAYGSSAQPYNIIGTPVANADGLTAFTESVGIIGPPDTPAGDGLFVARQDTSGAWHVLNSVPGSYNLIDHNTGGFYIDGINARDQVLASWIPDNLNSDDWYHSWAWAYDEKSNTMVDLSNVLGPGWGAIRTGGIDDDGRILLTAYSWSSVLTEEHELLLTPTDPSAAPVPEPSTFVVLALGVGGFAIRRRRQAG